MINSERKGGWCRSKCIENTRVFNFCLWEMSEIVCDQYLHVCLDLQVLLSILPRCPWPPWSNWVFHVRPFRCISVRLSDRSKVTQPKINFVKKCPQWGLNSQPPDHQSHALLTELARNLLEMSEVSFLLFHAPLHMLDFISRINRARL